MEFTRHPLLAPPLEEIAEVLSAALPDNYITSSATVVDCLDLRNEPFKLACAGLTGAETAADIGGKLNLFPQPRPEKHYWLIECARISHDGADIEPAFRCPASGSTDCALMMSLYGSLGLPGPVIKVTAEGRRGAAASFTEFMCLALREAYGEDRQVSLGGVFVMKKGRARYHVMPPFPPASELPFESQAALDGWLSYHNFDSPMVCFAVFHSADPRGLGVRLEHTHCFSNERGRGRPLLLCLGRRGGGI